MYSLLKKIFLTGLIAAALPAAVLAAPQVNLQLLINPAPANTNTAIVGGSGGGSGTESNPPVMTQRTVIVSGWTSPNAYVEATTGNKRAGETIAGSDGSFAMNAAVDGPPTLLVNSTDIFGALATLNTPSDLANAPASTANLVLPPSLSLPAAAFASGAPVVGSGRTVPGGTLSAALIAANGKTLTAFPAVGPAGDYRISFATKGLPDGAFLLQISLVFSGKTATASFNGTLGKVVTPIPVNPPPQAPGACLGQADLNCDGSVDLQDISIMLSFFNQRAFPSQYDLNGDGKIDLIDFSIMLFYLNPPAGGALSRADLAIATVSGAVAPIILDIGKDENGDWLAAWSGNGLGEINNAEISTDHGASWRPAASPYQLGKNRPDNVLLRATDASGKIVEAGYAHRSGRQILFAMLIGLLTAGLIVGIFALITHAHKKEHHFFHL